MKNSVLKEMLSLEKIIFRKIHPNQMKSMPTPTQMQIIGYVLRNKNDTYQKDLEEILNLRRATISGVLHTMEKNNLIKRVSSEDKRVKKIILSEKVNKIYSKHLEDFKVLEKKLIKDIPKEDLEIFLKVIIKMKENIRKEN